MFTIKSVWTAGGRLEPTCGNGAISAVIPVVPKHIRHLGKLVHHLQRAHCPFFEVIVVASGFSLIQRAWLNLFSRLAGVEISIIMVPLLLRVRIEILGVPTPGEIL